MATDPFEGNARLPQAHADERVGLCATCRHARRVTSMRESVFWQCGLAADDPTFSKYPALPVLDCAGYATDGATDD